MQSIELLASAGITVFSIGLLLLSLLSYKRNKNPKMIIISLVFIVFLIKGILFSYNLLYEEKIFFETNLNIIFLDFIILVLLYIASLKR